MRQRPSQRAEYTAPLNATGAMVSFQNSKKGDVMADSKPPEHTRRSVDNATQKFVELFGADDEFLDPATITTFITALNAMVAMCSNRAGLSDADYVERHRNPTRSDKKRSGRLAWQTVVDDMPRKGSGLKPKELRKARYAAKFKLVAAAESTARDATDEELIALRYEVEESMGL